MQTSRLRSSVPTAIYRATLIVMGLLSRHFLFLVFSLGCDRARPQTHRRRPEDAAQIARTRPSLLASGKFALTSAQSQRLAASSNGGGHLDKTQAGTRGHLAVLGPLVVRSLRCR